MTQETEAARLVARVRADISQYEREMARAGRTMDSTARDMERQASGASKGVSQQFNAMSTAAQMAGRAIQGIGWAKVVREIATTTEELARHGETVKQVAGNYERLTGASWGEGLGALQEATQRGADSLFLMEASSRLLASHLADSNQEAAELLRISAQLGKFAKGYSPEDAVANMLPLLSNQSALRLDEFGLSGERVQALAEKYEAAGMESGAAFKRAFVEEAAATLDAIGAQVVTATEQLAAAQADLKTNFAGALQYEQTGVMGLLGGAREWYTGAWQDVADHFGRIAQTRAQLAEFNQEVAEMHRWGVLAGPAYAAVAEQVDRLEGSAAWGKLSAPEMAAELERVRKLTPEVTASWAEWEGQIKGVDAATSGVMARMEQLAARKYVATLEIRQYLTTVGGAAQEAYDLASVSYELRRREDAQSSKVQQWLASKELARQAANRTRLEEAAQSTARGGGGMSEAERLMQQQQSELRSIAEGVFRPSSVTQEDWWATNTGAYVDKGDEYLRRLRSAVEDPGSQWKDLLGGRSGDAANLYLSEQTRAWQSGQWGALGPGFDAEASKAAMRGSIMQELEARRSREAMLAEILSGPEFAAMGVTASERAMLGGNTAQAAGIDFASGAARALESGDLGGEITRVVEKQFQATADLWVTMGTNAVDWLGQGIESAGPDLVQILARVLFPGIHDEMTRTGVLPTP